MAYRAGFGSPQGASGSKERILAEILSTVPPELQCPSADPGAVERGRRLFEVMRHIEIPPPMRRNVSRDEPGFYTRSYLSPQALVDLSKLIDEGPILWLPDDLINTGGEGKVSPMLAGTLLQSLIADAVKAASVGDRKQCASALSRCVKFHDWLSLNTSENDWVGQANLLRAAMQLIANEGWMGSAEWRQVCKAVPPASETDQDLIDRLKRYHLQDLRRLADFENGDECGSIDKLATAAMMSRARILDIANLGRPYTEQDPQVDPAVKELVDALPIPPDEHQFISRPEAEYQKAYDAYCTAMDALPNSLGARFLSGTASDFTYSFARRTVREVIRGFTAACAFRIEKGRLPIGWEELTMAGLLEEAPRDFFIAEPLPYNPATGQLWTVGPDGKTNGKDNAYALMGLKVGPPGDWIWALPRT
jgi:hypothetical protein